MKIKVLNDLHLGVQRSAGTTVSSRQALHAFQIQQLHNLLNEDYQNIDYVLINGDLFDTFNVSTSVFFDTFRVFKGFLMRKGSPKLIFSEGNHDLSKDNQKISSLRLLYAILAEEHEVTYISEKPVNFSAQVLIVPHIRRQEDFEEHLETLCEQTEPLPSFIFLHANYDNPFAGAFDHSLNVSAELAHKLQVRGSHLIFGHEHQRRKVGDKLLITGNQIPTSIDDVRFGKDKIYVVVDTNTKEVTEIPCWEGTKFVSQNWRELNSEAVDAPFVRVTGEYQSTEALQVVDILARLRKESTAFIVSNQTEVIKTEAEVFEAQTNDFEITSYLLDTCPPRLKDLLQEKLSCNSPN